MNHIMNKISRTVIGLSAAALLVTGVGISAASASSEAASASKIPAPVAAVPALFGGNTAVALDSNFLAALKSLGVTPGVLGTATLTNGSVAFPITGGSVVY